MGEAILTACHVLNSAPPKKTSLTPFELWKGHKLNLGHFKVWGCLAFVRLIDLKIPKLSVRATTCAFLGYAVNSTTYRFLNIETNVIFELGDAIFHEEKFPFKSKNSGGAKKLEKMCYLSLVLLLLIHKIKKILKLNLEGVKELELKKILALTIMFLMLMKILLL